MHFFKYFYTKHCYFLVFYVFLVNSESSQQNNHRNSHGLTNKITAKLTQTLVILARWTSLTKNMYYHVIYGQPKLALRPRAATQAKKKPTHIFFHWITPIQIQLKVRNSCFWQPLCCPPVSRAHHCRARHSETHFSTPDAAKVFPGASNTSPDAPKLPKDWKIAFRDCIFLTNFSNEWTFFLGRRSSLLPLTRNSYADSLTA